jgi:diguanylate cyclase (GGDEF)-like protein/PAS domain S-box-containing protein
MAPARAWRFATQAAQAALLALVCVLAGWASRWQHVAPTYEGLLWLPTGISLAAMLRFGTRVWWGAFAGMSFVAVSSGLPQWTALLLAAGNTLAAVLGALWLTRLSTHRPIRLGQHLGRYALVGAVVMAFVSASNATLWLGTAGIVLSADAPAIWGSAWMGDAVGAFVVGVPLAVYTRTGADRMARSDWWQAVTLGAGAAVTAWFAQRYSSQLGGLLSPLVCIPHLLLAVLTLRHGLLAGSLAVPAALVGAVVAGHAGDGFATGLIGAPPSPFHVWGYAATLAAVPLLVAGAWRRLNARKQRMQLALHASGLGVAEWDLRRAQIVLSPRWLEMLGYRTQAFGTSLESFFGRVHPEDLELARSAFESLRGSPDSVGHCECRMLSQDGRWLALELRTRVAERGSHAEPRHVICTAVEIGDRVAARDHRNLAEHVFGLLHEGLLITDSKHRVLDLNPTYSEITGYSREETLGTVPAMLQLAHHGFAEGGPHLSMRTSLETTGAWSGEIFSRRRNGEACTLQVVASTVRNRVGAVQNHVLAISDVTQVRQQIEQLKRQAHYDELTGLPNRAKLTQILMEALATCDREGTLLTVCFLDLDYFKPVNDQFGHHMGDQLLVKLAERLRRSLRTRASGDDVVARISGDEFVLLLRTATLDESRLAVERMLRQVHQPFALDVSEAPVYVTASIGATVYPLDQADAETLLRHADHAMYGAKQAGRNGYQFFDAEHDRRTEARFVALGRVQDALDAEEFCLYFQPKVDMHDGRVLGVEALLRWNHPEQGLLLPAQFLPLIEHTGLAVSVGNWVLKKGIEQLAEWLSMGLDLTVSINVSARHLQEPMFAQQLALLLSQQRTPVADRLVIEILETTALADVDYTCKLMQECRALGVRFALDDFGTGYSTLTYLKRLPLDMLKIDRSFVINMLNDRHDLAIVEGVIGLSETFGCTVVAEGVDTLEQAQRLIEIGCHIGQGNGIAPAMPADEVVSWVHSFSGISTLAAPLVD